MRFGPPIRRLPAGRRRRRSIRWRSPAFTLAVFLKTLGFTGWGNGAMVGFFAWLGFTVTALAVVQTFGYRKPMFTVIDGGNWLVTLLAMGAIIGALG